RGGERKDLEIRVGERPTLEEPEVESEEPRDQQEGKTGLTLQNLTPEIARQLGFPPETKGVVVSSVAGGSPGAHASLQRGDVILEVDRKPVENIKDFRKAITGKGNYLLRVR